MSEFTLGQCSGCGKHRALKDGRCVECKIPIDGMDFDGFDTIFGKGWQNGMARGEGTSSKGNSN